MGSSGLALIGAGLIVGSRLFRSRVGKEGRARLDEDGDGDGEGALRDATGNVDEGRREGVNGAGGRMATASELPEGGKEAEVGRRVNGVYRAEPMPGTMQWQVPPATGPEFSGFRGETPKPRRFDEVIDLSPPAYYMDRFCIHNEANHERVMELRIGNREGNDFLFVRVNTHGKASELSSGLYHCGVRTETSHGFTPGEGEGGPMLLRCALKFDGECFKLDMRLQTDCPQRKTLVYGSGVFEYPGLGPEAWVSMREEELKFSGGGIL
jgi:hypothetical protein